MKIIHYALGFPPYRSGGLTKFCIDLMTTQKEHGYDVYLLWPGQIRVFNNQLSIKQRKSMDGIQSYEIINPLPIALDEGIPNAKLYMKSANKDVYKSLFTKIQPTAIHIHTLMGLHKEMIEAANELKVKTVFTTHDYYGLCPKVTLYKDGKVCNYDHDCKDCVRCNVSGLSYSKIIAMQSPMYRRLKNSIIISFLRKQHRTKHFKENVTTNKQQSEEINKKAETYRELRQYYKGMLESIDIIHYNSSVSKQIYEKYINAKNSKTINITHRDIKDNRKIKAFDNDKLRITFLAPIKPFKGFFILKQALDSLWQKGIQNFELNIYSFTDDTSPYMILHGSYNYNNLEDIFEHSDLLVAPSIWYETFGFTVLEALSYGVPVLVSQNVGAKDIVYKCDNIVLNNLSVAELAKEIEELTSEKLQILNANILSKIDILTADIMGDEINELYLSK